MGTELVFETHSTSEDNEHGIATGWHHGRLSELGREQASQLGQRRQDDGVTTVFTSDLGRAIETATIAFAGTDIPLLHDWRLRECDYGDLNGGSATEVHDNRRSHLDHAYRGGESWRQAVDRVGGFLDDLPTRWDGSRVLVIGHIATRWAFEHLLNGRSLEDLAEEDFRWREGWEYNLK
jgi:broad specificity phosphatase PhoE